MKAETAGAIIVAAGASRRMGGINKMMASLGGKPVLVWSVEAFEKSEYISQIVIVAGKDNLTPFCKMTIEQGWAKVSDIVLGGDRRQDSVAAGLSRLKTDWVLIHDGARPLVSEKLIQEGLEAAKETGAAVAAVRVKDTIKESDENLIVTQTLQRENLWAVQTPQVFKFDIIQEAFRYHNSDVTDDASLVEIAGHKVKLYPGSYDNIKITTPEDMALAELILKRNDK